MGDHMIISVNEDEINKLMTLILDYSSRINQIFNRIDDLVCDSKTYYESNDATIFRSKFNALKSDFKLVTRNLSSYNQDLARLKTKFRNTNDIISNKIRRDATSYKIDVAKK